MVTVAELGSKDLRYRPGAPVTPKQLEILKFMARHFGEHGVMPTIREIGTEFRISSPNGVRCHLTALLEKGYLVWANSSGKRARSLIIPELLAAVRVASEEFIKGLE